MGLQFRQQMDYSTSTGLVQDQLGEFGRAGLYLLAGAGFVLLGYFTNWLLAPNRPNPEKQTTYECGEEPLGGAWHQFNVRFYGVALVFLLFDVEVLLLFPWAVVFANAPGGGEPSAWVNLAVLEGLVFIAVLAMGLVYVWQRGDLDWSRPEPLPPDAPAPVPLAVYQGFSGAKATGRPN